MSDDESLEEGVTNPDTDLVPPLLLEYMPWHKPRKQFVRGKQWIHHSRSRVEDLQCRGYFQGNVPLKYLTLPGPDLIDIRLMIDLCAEMGVKLHYTGFCTDTDNQQIRLRQNISQFRASNNDVVAPGSDVHKVALQGIVHMGSSAHNELLKGGPYQIVNIDACTPLLTGDVDATGRLIDAVKFIIEFQVNSEAVPWILLLTTPLQRENITDGFLDRLNAQIKENYNASEDFAKKLKESFEDGEELDAFLARMSAEHGCNFLNIATLGISKWLVHLGEAGNCRVKKLNGFCYSTFGEHPLLPNMISVCYLFEKQERALNDRSGITRNIENQINLPNQDDHIRALNKSFDMTNVDQLLKNDHALYETMIVETMRLLSDIGYDVEQEGKSYREWISQDITHDFVHNLGNEISIQNDGKN
ncbi:MAG: hypothetical protein COB49_08550 [Alphaproteobacteria bacterium]|nr:MAG: hypothetical protein COB49_08550 [Alphaproteobacteria bacterium]